MKVPIIFIHYGNSSYLEYTLKTCKLFNPDKEIVLLGDESNYHLSKLGIKHIFFKDLELGKELVTFNNVYKFIGGENHGKNYWTNFVFKRWFYICNYLEREGIETFWTFDSDNLILTPLSNQESKFKNIDCTEQCSGDCINGFINGKKIVKGYIDKINELFERKEYLEEIKTQLKEKPDWAYTEMHAYKVYKKENNLKTQRLNSIFNKETFDDCICWEDGMETYEVKTLNRSIKKLYFSSDGNIYTYHTKSASYIKANSINLSWVPDYFYKRIFLHSKKKIKSGIESSFDPSHLTVLNPEPDLLYKANFKLKLLKKLIK